MHWITARYMIPGRTSHDEDRPARTLINLDHVRRVGEQNGRARIYWTTRVDALTLSEPYEAFIARVLAANPPEPPTNQGGNP